MLLPIVGQILTDGLCMLNVYYWHWPPQTAALFEAVTPGLFGARSMFWVGVISYISDNSPDELRTLKYGVVNAVYTVSSLFGTGLAGFLNVRLGFYGAFAVPVALNSAAVAVVCYAVPDSSVPYDADVAWLTPKRFCRGYLNVFRGGTRPFAVALVALLLCQAVLVGRIGGERPRPAAPPPPQKLIFKRLKSYSFAGEYAVIYLFVRKRFEWYEVKYSYFAAYKMMTIFFGNYFRIFSPLNNK